MSIVVQTRAFRKAEPTRILDNLHIRIKKDGSIAPLALWSKLTDPRGWGKFDAIDGKPKYAVTIGGLLAGRFPNSISNEQLQDHYAGVSPLYFSADAYPKDYRYTLAGIDIDAGGRHGKGASVCALAFLNREVIPLFGDHLYWERSRNGVGINAYFIVERVTLASGMGIGLALKHLDAYLKSRVQPDDDIAVVETKGLPSKYTYAANPETTQFQLKNVERGSLLRIPTTQDFKRLLSTSIVSPMELIDLQIEAPIRQLIAPEPQKAIECKVAPVADSTPLKAGSTANGMTHGDLAKLDRFDRKAQKLFNQFPMNERVRNAKKVERLDVAIMLLILEYINRNLNDIPRDPETLPFRRVKQLWQMLYDEGHVDRSPANERITLIRNWLSGINAIEWIDNTYSPPSRDEFGKKVKGTSCKWSLKATFVAWINDADTTHTSLIPSEIHVVACIRPESSIPIRMNGEFGRLRMIHSDIEPLLFEYRLAA